MTDHAIMECEECKNRNYVIFKNKKNTTERLQLKKCCKFYRTRTNRKETK